MARVTGRPRKTVQDWLDLPEDVRAELIEGDIYVTPAPTPDHQRCSRRLLVRLDRWAGGHGAEVFAAPLGVHLPSDDVVEPDLILVGQHQGGIVHEKLIRGVPQLLIEIVSPSHPGLDQIVKRDLYARNGVPEYWIVHPEDEAIEVLRLSGGAYDPAGYFQRGSTLTTPSLPDFSLPIDEAFA